MKQYWAAHRTFVIAAGATLLAALVLLFGLALPWRSAASQADEDAARLQRSLKAGEGSALSGTARRQLESEVEALRARVAELEKRAGPPKVEGGTDKVSYANKLAALDTQINKAAENGVTMEGEVAFPKSPEDLPLFSQKLEIAQSVLARAVSSGIKRIRQISAATGSDDFFTTDMAEAGAVRRTVVVFEVAGTMDAVAKLLHALQQKDGFAVIPRAKAWRDKPDDPETTLRIAVGGVAVTDAKAPDKAADSGGFIFGR